jgi:hypothetical protein
MNLVERFMGFDNLEYSALLITSGPTHYISVPVWECQLERLCLVR